MSHRRERRKNAGSKVEKFHSAQRAAGSRHGPREMHPDAISDACVPINASVRIPAGQTRTKVANASAGRLPACFFSSVCATGF